MAEQKTSAEESIFKKVKPSKANSARFSTEGRLAKVQRELDTGLRETRPFELKAEIEKGRFFIVGGQMAYVAEKGEQTLTDQGRTDARLRVIFDNGTESNMLMRSLQRALNKDEAGRRITDPAAGPLFSGEVEDSECVQAGADNYMFWQSSGVVQNFIISPEQAWIIRRHPLFYQVGSIP